jgi:hypothetical protein
MPVWFISHCLAVHGTCQPRNWADLGEVIAGAALIAAAAIAFFTGLSALG